MRLPFSRISIGKALLWLAIGLVLAACGGDDETADTAGAETTAGSETTAGGTETTAGEGTDTSVASECSLESLLKIGFAADLGELGAVDIARNARADLDGVHGLEAAGEVVPLAERRFELS